MNIKGSEVFLWVLIGLAIVASIIMMFSSSDAWQKIAVLAALWAAALGAFLVMKMRGESQADADRVKELETQLDHERARSEESDETLAAIREQLEAMRAQLEELTGRTYEYEPNSITASATRLWEIGSTPDDSWRDTEEPEEAEVVPTATDQGGSHEQPADEEPAPEGETAAWEWTPPSNSYVEPAEEDYHGRRRKEDPFDFDFVGSYVPAEEEYHGHRRKEDFGGWAPVMDDTSADEALRGPAKPDQTAQIPQVREEQSSGHGRRRADDREGGVSVAELLKNLKK